MRSARFGLLFCFLFLNISVGAQQPQQTTAPPSTTQDPQAVSVLSQVLSAAGGTAAIRAIHDYTASGNITYPSEQGAQGTVTVIALAGTEFRMDANLPSGTRSWAVHEGVISTKDERGRIRSLVPNSSAPSSDAFPFQTPLFPGSIPFPFRQLATVVGNTGYGLTYKGIVEVDGHSVHEIELQRGSSGAGSSSINALPRRTRDIFIDTRTFQVIKVSDNLPRGVLHEIHYSDYRPVGGCLMSFSIIEDVAGQQAWTIQLNQISYNTGLQDSSFAIQ